MRQEKGKYLRGAIKMHTMLDLRGSIPNFILITDGKYHDSNILDEIIPIQGAIYLMDKTYLDLVALYRMHKSGSFFVTRTRVTQDFMDIDCNYNLDEKSGLRSDKIIKLKGPKSKYRYPETLRLVEYYDDEKDILLEFLTNNFDASALMVKSRLSS